MLRKAGVGTGTAPGETVTITLDGHEVRVPAGMSLAAALLAADVPAFRRTPVSDTARGPYCMMGVCFDCLVEVDGETNRQSCLIPVEDGMTVRRGRPPELDLDGGGETGA